MNSIFHPQYREVDAVKSISFSVGEGEMLGFIGPNGAGKSTTIKMLTGILFPSSGRAEVLGVVPWENRQRLAYSIGSVFGQKSQLWYHLPPLDSLRLLGRIYELDHRVFQKRVDELVELFELKELIKTPVRKLSLGERMRCEIAACVLHQPKVIFLDEPTIGLDVVAKLKIRQLIQELNREQRVTVFLTSHDAGDIEQLCKRVIIINHGELVLDSPVSSLRHNYLSAKIIAVRLAEPMAEFANPGVQVLKHTHKGIKLRVDTQVSSMESVLTQLMREAKVADISISDPSMEEIIRSIYGRPAKEETSHEAV